MKKLNEKEINNLSRNFSFYNFENLYGTTSKEVKIEFDEYCNNITFNDLNYNDLNYNANREVCTKKGKILSDLVRLILSKCIDNSCVVIKYNECWVMNNKKSKALYRILKQNNIKNKNTKALLIEKKSEELDLFILSVLKYNSFIQFLLKDEQIVITITDHMDIFVCFINDNFFIILQDCIKKINTDYYKNQDFYTGLFKLRYNYI